MSTPLPDGNCGNGSRSWLNATVEPFNEPQPAITTDPRFALEHDRGRIAFLHATIDKTQAVVGEQITFSVFLYVDAAEHPPDFTDVHEATADDFVKRALFEDDQNDHQLGHALAGGRVWRVKLLRKSALFPLKT
jgi:hypothetical protein